MVTAGKQALGPLEVLNSPRETTSEALAEAVRLLRSAEYVELHRVECDMLDGVLTLRGSVTRFHLKQRAYHTVAGVRGVTRVSNEIAVQLCKAQPEIVV